MNTKSDFWIFIGGVYTLILVIAGILWFYPTTIGGQEINWGYQVILIAGIYITMSGVIINHDEIGMVKFLGRGIFNVSAGWIPVLRPFFTFEKHSRNIIQDESPPINVTFGLPDPQSGIDRNDPLNMRMVLPVVASIPCEIRDYMKFAMKFGTIEKALKTIEDTVAAVFTEHLTKVTPAVAMRDTAKYNVELEKALDKIFKEDCGIDFLRSEVKRFILPDDLSQALLSLPKAIAEGNGDIHRAQTQKEVLRLSGEGEGAAIQAKINGETAGLKDRMEKMKIGGESVLATQIAQSLADGGNTVIMGANGLTELVASANIIGVALNQKGATS